MDEEWVLFFRDSAGRDVRVASTSKQAALIQAKELLRQHYVVHKLEGPDEVIDGRAIEEWVKAISGRRSAQAQARRERDARPPQRHRAHAPDRGRRRGRARRARMASLKFRPLRRLTCYAAVAGASLLAAMSTRSSSTASGWPVLPPMRAEHRPPRKTEKCVYEETNGWLQLRSGEV